ncbi:hypothetical protein jhhlp_005363 [Lomentospora prolificans]|uniref:D-arabinono-1,4-lactone oxidase n=1 Tax=Lomentospora prolificans TaxID=41688 RepID=A0A2N3N6N1_9PEZI|nr:hypothetical protein jhhlp_005363 [Lomentospora prolificans]
MESVLQCCGAARKQPKNDAMRSDALYNSIKQTIEKLREDPEDEQQQKKAERAFDKHLDVVFDVLKEEVRVPVPPAPNQPALVPPVQDSDRDWMNSVGEQRCTPREKAKPANLKQLVQIVTKAKESGTRVRAIGSGHAFSDIARTDDAILVNPILLNDIEEVDLGALREEARGETLINVQAGITLRLLKQELDDRGLALINMGGYDAQTISGTFATGTHGSGISFGPLSSFARSVVLVTETGAVYQIEKTNGITDPEKFSGQINGIEVTLKQDDEWFNTISTSMGCMGIAYSYIIAVTPAYSLRELRSSTTWNDIKKSLTPNLWNPIPPIIADNDHFELVLNPYNRWFRHACVKVERKRLVGNVPQQGERQDWFEALLQQISLQSAPDLVNFLNSIPFLSPLIIDAAIMTLVYEEPYIDKSFNIFSLGSANEIKAMALELHCDAKQTVPTIDKLLGVLRDKVFEAPWFLAGPIGIRWIASSDGFLAPQSGRMTCSMELTMLVGVKTGRELARYVKERMCEKDSASVRVHWGLDLDFVTGEDVKAWYPHFDRWQAVYTQLNSTGMFNNKFTDRIGISMPRSA